LDKFEIQKAVDYIWKEIRDLDILIQERKPWVSKNKEIIADLVIKLSRIAYNLTPFLPATSEKIMNAIKNNKMPVSLFPRIEARR